MLCAAPGCASSTDARMIMRNSRNEECPEERWGTHAPMYIPRNHFSHLMQIEISWISFLKTESLRPRVARHRPLTLDVLSINKPSLSHSHLFRPCDTGPWTRKDNSRALTSCWCRQAAAPGRPTAIPAYSHHHGAHPRLGPRALETDRTVARSLLR